jgi:hypothetical protein
MISSDRQSEARAAAANGQGQGKKYLQNPDQMSIIFRCRALDPPRDGGFL